MKTTAIIALLCALAAAAVTAYPKLEMSFRAVGNIYVQGDGGGGKQISFEENYERGTERSSLSTMVAGIKATVVEHHLERQAVIYRDENKCEEFSTKDANFETDIRSVKIDGSGQYVLPIHQLLTLNTSCLKDTNPVQFTLENGATVNRWTFNIIETEAKLEIQADWTLPSTTTASAYPETPVRFGIKRSVKVNGIWQMTSEQTVNVELFTHGEFRRQVFRPHRGVYCPTRKEPNVFPELVLEKLKGLKTKVEQVVKDYSRVGVVDTWFDPSNKLFRINYSPIREQVQNGIQRIVSHVQGVVYEMAEARKCAVKKVKEVKDTFDPQMIFNPFDSQDFSMETMFGIGKVHYNSVGEVIDRGIPCNLYQGVRTDWPSKDSGIETLWEWCLADQTLPEVKFELNGFPLISLNIYVKKSPYKQQAENFYYEGLQLAYNFYDVRNASNQYLDNLAFDIQECFEDANQKILQFKAEVKDKIVRELLERNERHKEHVAAWTEAIIKAAKVHASSLRVARVQTQVTEEGLEVQFVLLGRHPSLPPEVDEIPLDDALGNVKVAVDEQQLSVSVDVGTDKTKQKVDMTAQPGTLKAKSVEDDSGSGKGSSSVTAATMGAVAVVMLALGVAIGAAVIFKRKRRMYQRV